MVWLPVVSRGVAARHLASWAVAPYREELELLITGAIPSLASPLGVHNQSWWGRCQLRLPALPAEGEGWALPLVP